MSQELLANYVPATHFPLNRKRKAVRFTTAASIAIEPFYSGFVFLSMAEYLIKAAGGEEISWGIKFAVYAASTIPCLSNLFSDMTAADPFREADELLGHKKAKSSGLWGLVLKSIAIPFSFLVGGEADAIPIAALSKYIPVDLLAASINYFALAAIGVLGIVYYVMLTGKPIDEHVNAFKGVVKHPLVFLSNVFSPSNFFHYLEVVFQAFSNMLYRGVAFAYIFGGVLKDIFNVPKDSKGSGIGGKFVGSATILVTLFSRVLKTHARFLNPEFKYLTDAELEAVPKFWKGYFVDLFFSAVRGGATSWFLISSSPATWLTWGLATGFGGLLTYHSAVVRYDAARNALALNKISNQRKAEIKNLVNAESPKEPEVANGETTVLLANDHTAIIEQFGKDFDKVAEKHDSAGMNLAIDVINVLARVARFIAFFKFMDDVNKFYLGDGVTGALNPSATLSLATLWGAEVFKNDGDSFRAWMKGVWQTKITLFGMNGLKNSERGFFGKVYDAAFDSPYNHSSRELQNYNSTLPVAAMA